MEIPRVTPRQVQEMLNQRELVVFVDARNPQDWQASAYKIPDARRARSDEEVERALEELHPEETVVTYCT